MGFPYGRQNVRGASNLPVFASAAETWGLDSRTRMDSEPGGFVHRHQHQHPVTLVGATSRSDVAGGGWMLTTLALIIAFWVIPLVAAYLMLRDNEK